MRSEKTAATVSVSSSTFANTNCLLVAALTGRFRSTSRWATSQRRKSPSVRMPSSLPDSLTANTTRFLLSLILRSALRMLSSAKTMY